MSARRGPNQRGQNIGGANWSGAYGDPSVIPPPSAFGQSLAGVSVTERSVLGLMTVFACLRILGDIVGDLGVHVYKQTPVGQPNIEVEVPDVIADPFADDFTFTGTFKQVASLGLAGNLYRQIVDRDEDGNPLQYELLNPSLIKVEMIKGIKTYRVGTVGKFLDPKNIIHVPWVALASGLQGLNPIEIGATGFSLGIASEEYAARYFKQGIMPGGILSVNKPMMPADAQQLQQKLSVDHGGIANAHIPLVVDAETKWTQISVNPATAQLLESRTFTKGEIAGFYGVPLYFLADTSARGGTEVKGIEEMMIGFVETAIKGYVKRLDIADTAMLPPGYFAKRNMLDLYKTNTQMMSLYLTALRNTSTATPNELRQLVNLPRSSEPAADSLFAPLNSNTAPDWNPAALAGEPSDVPNQPDPDAGNTP